MLTDHGLEVRPNPARICNDLVSVALRYVFAAEVVAHRFGVRNVEVAVNANPVHRSTFGHLILANDRRVVLGDAGRDTGIAPRTRPEVDRHAPTPIALDSLLAVDLLRILRIQAQRNDPRIVWLMLFVVLFLAVRVPVTFVLGSS